MLTLRLQREKLLQTYGDAHPMIKEVDKMMDLVKQLYGRGNVADFFLA